MEYTFTPKATGNSILKWIQDHMIYVIIIVVVVVVIIVVIIVVACVVRRKKSQGYQKLKSDF